MNMELNENKRNLLLNSEKKTSFIIDSSDKKKRLIQATVNI